ncbi:9554_t:CDS:2 [Funneliformis mosseae]|uniref:9554_t:CDS:1 n=1 Tax=Funneliformis mosseae TaxID=27381 RepID=A0A9N9C8B4_FUNMO|nr:9554_t:CDS:2 [Funneliformis mosseae]
MLCKALNGNSSDDSSKISLVAVSTLSVSQFPYLSLSDSDERDE